MPPEPVTESGYSWLLTKSARPGQPAWKWPCTPQDNIPIGGKAADGIEQLLAGLPALPEKAPETTSSAFCWDARGNSVPVRYRKRRLLTTATPAVSPT